MSVNSSAGLEKFYQFFRKVGSERLHGLDESYFCNLTATEREEAWTFLAKHSRLTDEIMSGLFLLDKRRSIDLFKTVLLSPLEHSSYVAERRGIERARLTLLYYINKTQPEVEYLNQMIRFSKNEFEEIRMLFAMALPEEKTTPEILHALKSMIFTENDTFVLGSAIMKFMAIHGMDFDISNDNYKSIYNSIRIGGESERISAIGAVERVRKLDFL